MNKHVPCDNCPWRRSSPVGGCTIPGYSKRLARNLVNTCSRDGFALMACHKSSEGSDIVCGGFLRVIGFDSIGVRLAAHRGRVDASICGVGGDDLYGSFEEMNEANGLDEP